MVPNDIQYVHQGEPDSLTHALAVRQTQQSSYSSSAITHHSATIGRNDQGDDSQSNLPHSPSDLPARAEAGHATCGIVLTGTASGTPCHPFYALPSELILDIIDLLPPEAFINLAFANYPLLQANGLAPVLSRKHVQYLTSHTRILSLFPLLRIPAEITLHIMHHLKPLDIMRFVVANYQDLARQGIAPPLMGGTVQELRRAIEVQ